MLCGGPVMILATLVARRELLHRFRADEAPNIAFSAILAHWQYLDSATNSGDEV